MQDRTAASLALELVRRFRLPSLQTVYWVLRIALLIVGFMVITNWAEIVQSVGVMFSGKVTEAVQVIDENTEEVKTVIGDGVTEITDAQKEMQGTLDDITNHKNEIIQEIRKANKMASTPRTIGERQTIAAEEAAKPFKIMPSAPLSESDVLIIQQDETIYSQERKRSTIQPSSQ